MAHPRIPVLLVAAAAIILAACSVDAAPAAPSTNTPPAIAELSPENPTAPPITAEPTTTTAPTEAPTATTTPTPEPTPPPHPLQIEVMRQQEYPGSEITFVETLPSGVNYAQHVVSYESEGNTIFALMTIPFGEPPETGWPVVIFNHGYIPPEIYRTTERYEAYVDGIARHGYIVFKSDYRGHGFSEGEASGGYSTPAYTIDVLNAVASVKQYPDADPNRIGMWGHSMGGHITMRSMVVTDDIKAGVIWAGVVSSYPDFFNVWWETSVQEILEATPDTERWRRDWLREMFQTYGTPDENPEFWASIGPNAYLEDLSGPIQLHHGTNDSSVPIEISRILNREMTALGLPVELNVYEGDDHNISQSFSTAMLYSIQFFDEHVKGVQPTP